MQLSHWCCKQLSCQFSICFVEMNFSSLCFHKQSLNFLILFYSRKGLWSGKKKKNHRYRNFGISCPYPVDNKELTPFWSLFLKKSEPPGFWPRWGYLAFNFASSTFSGLITLSSISWKTISNTVNEIYNNELFMQNTFAGNSPTCWLLLPSEYTNYFNRHFHTFSLKYRQQL